MSGKNQIDLGNALKKLRELKGMTQAELAETTGFSIGYISKLETGTRHGISTRNLERLSSGLGVAPSLVYVLADQRDREEVRLLQDLVAKVIGSNREEVRALRRVINPYLANLEH